MTEFVRFIPTIGERGHYRLKAPFEIREGEIFTCKSIRKISELFDEQVDVYAEYYKPAGISEEVYEKDVADDGCIIYLASDVNRWVICPDHYLLGYPNVNGKAYVRLNVVFSLPPMSVEQDYTQLKAQLEEVVQMTLGVKPGTILLDRKSHQLAVPLEKHEALQADRKALAQADTPTRRAAYWRTKFDELKAKFDILSNHVKQKG